MTTAYQGPRRLRGLLDREGSWLRRVSSVCLTGVEVDEQVTQLQCVQQVKLVRCRAPLHVVQQLRDNGVELVIVDCEILGAATPPTTSSSVDG